jgi:SAM-dependent methyltransferase
MTFTSFFAGRQPHIHTAHALWKSAVEQGDMVIDATCGNGHDTLRLAQLVLTTHSGKVVALDIQEEAIKNTKKILEENLGKEIQRRIELHQRSHIEFPETVEKQTVKLIVYNLGYLPGGDKQVTTRVESTLKSLQNALNLLAPQGLITVTCYPGHPEGKREENAVLSWAAGLEAQKWRIVHQQWLNRLHSPSLLLLYKVIID